MKKERKWVTKNSASSRVSVRWAVKRKVTKNERKSWVELLKNEEKQLDERTKTNEKEELRTKKKRRSWTNNEAAWRLEDEQKRTDEEDERRTYKKRRS